MTVVLLVDDEDALRRPVARVLERAGYAVIQSRQGSEALKFLGEVPFDVLVLDMHLPDMTGFEVLEAMRKAGVTVPGIVVITGDAENPRMKKLSQLGVSAVLAKPFSLVELIDLVKDVGGDSRAQSQ